MATLEPTHIVIYSRVAVGGVMAERRAHREADHAVRNYTTARERDVNAAWDARKRLACVLPSA
jgi:hypothetical protein